MRVFNFTGKKKRFEWYHQRETRKSNERTLSLLEHLENYSR